MKSRLAKLRAALYDIDAAAREKEFERQKERGRDGSQGGGKDGQSRGPSGSAASGVTEDDGSVWGTEGPGASDTAGRSGTAGRGGKASTTRGKKSLNPNILKHNAKVARQLRDDKGFEQRKTSAHVLETQLRNMSGKATTSVWDLLITRLRLYAARKYGNSKADTDKMEQKCSSWWTLAKPRDMYAKVDDTFTTKPTDPVFKQWQEDYWREMRWQKRWKGEKGSYKEWLQENRKGKRGGKWTKHGSAAPAKTKTGFAVGASGRRGMNKSGGNFNKSGNRKASAAERMSRSASHPNRSASAVVVNQLSGSRIKFKPDGGATFGGGFTTGDGLSHSVDYGGTLEAARPKTRREQQIEADRLRTERQNRLQRELQEEQARKRVVRPKAANAAKMKNNFQTMNKHTSQSSNMDQFSTTASSGAHVPQSHQYARGFGAAAQQYPPHGQFAGQPLPGQSPYAGGAPHAVPPPNPVQQAFLAGVQHAGQQYGAAQFRQGAPHYGQMQQPRPQQMTMQQHPQRTLAMQQAQQMQQRSSLMAHQAQHPHTMPAGHVRNMSAQQLYANNNAGSRNPAQNTLTTSSSSEHNEVRRNSSASTYENRFGILKIENNAAKAPSRKKTAREQGKLAAERQNLGYEAPVPRKNKAPSRYVAAKADRRRSHQAPTGAGVGGAAAGIGAAAPLAAKAAAGAPGNAIPAAQLRSSPPKAAGAVVAGKAVPQPRGGTGAQVQSQAASPPSNSAKAGAHITGSAKAAAARHKAEAQTASLRTVRVSVPASTGSLPKKLIPVSGGPSGSPRKLANLVPVGKTTSGLKPAGVVANGRVLQQLSGGPSLPKGAITPIVAPSGNITRHLSKNSVISREPSKTIDLSRAPTKIVANEGATGGATGTGASSSSSSSANAANPNGNTEANTNNTNDASHSAPKNAEGTHNMAAPDATSPATQCRRIHLSEGRHTMANGYDGNGKEDEGQHGMPSAGRTRDNRASAGHKVEGTHNDVNNKQQDSQSTKSSGRRSARPRNTAENELLKKTASNASQNTAATANEAKREAITSVNKSKTTDSLTNPKLKPPIVPEKKNLCGPLAFLEKQDQEFFVSATEIGCFYTTPLYVNDTPLGENNIMELMTEYDKKNGFTQNMYAKKTAKTTGRGKKTAASSPTDDAEWSPATKRIMREIEGSPPADGTRKRDTVGENLKYHHYEESRPANYSDSIANIVNMCRF